MSPQRRTGPTGVPQRRIHGHRYAEPMPELRIEASHLRNGVGQLVVVVWDDLIVQQLRVRYWM